MKAYCRAGFVAVMCGVGILLPLAAGSQPLVLLDADLQDGYQRLETVVGVDWEQEVAVEIYGKRIDF